MKKDNHHIVTRKTIEADILDELKREEEEIVRIKDEVDKLCEKIIEKPIKPFSGKDIVHALFGALVIGLTFVFKGLLIEVGLNLPWQNIVIIIITTLLILTCEIYFIGYSRVKNKKERPVGQFIFKRLVTMYTIAFLVSLLLLSIFGFLTLSGSLGNFFKLVFVIAMPCSVGAAIPNMLKQ